VSGRARSAALVLLALALGGCETTAEQSAKLERKAKLEKAEHPQLQAKGLSIARASNQVKVLDATVVHSSEGTAAAVTLRNLTARTLHSVPIAITVKDAHGNTLFQNNSPGLEAALTSLASLPAHGVATWVDDQVSANGEPASVSALVGAARSAPGPQPRIEVAGLHSSEESGSGGAAATVRNDSKVAQRALVVYVLAHRAGKLVAAGRAVLSALAPGGSAPFQVYLVGSPAGAALTASAPPTTLR
jgi:hypothetical protein